MPAARLVHLALLTGLPLAVSFVWTVDALAPKEAIWLLGGALVLVVPPAPDLRRAWPASALLAIAALGCLYGPSSPAPLTPWLVGILLYLRTRELAADAALGRRWIRWTVTVAALVALNGIAQAVWNRLGTDIQLVNPFGLRVLSTLGNPTFLGDYLALHLPQALHLATTAAGRAAAAGWTGAGLLIGIAIVLSGSKGGMLAAAAGATVWMAATAIRGAMPPRRLAAGVAGTLIAGGIAIALLPGGMEALGRWTAAADRFSFSQRWQILRGSADLVVRRPLTGYGTGAFPVMFPSVQPPALGRELGVKLSVNHAHLDYLEVAADLGIPALLLTAWLLLAGLRRWRDPGPAGAIAAAQAATAVSMATNFVLFLPSSAFFAWFHAGLLAGPGRGPAVPPPLPRRFAVLLAAWLSLSAGRLLVSTANLHYGADAVDRGDGIASERWLRNAASLTPDNRHAWQYLGRSHEIRGDLDAALGAYERALSLGPHHAITWLNVGRIERQRYLDHRILRHGSRSRAIAALRRCIAANPYVTDARIWGGDLATLAGSADDAQAFLGDAPPDLTRSAAWHRARQRWLLALRNTRAADLEGARADDLEARAALAPAERHLAEGRHAEAIRVALDAAKRWPRYAPAWELIGFARHQLSDAPGAREAFVTLSRLQPDSLTAQLNLAMLALNARQPAAAERYLNRAAAIDAASPEVHLGLARLRAVQGRRADAIAAYERCLALRPDHPEAGPELQRMRNP